MNCLYKPALLDNFISNGVNAPRSAEFALLLQNLRLRAGWRGILHLALLAPLNMKLFNGVNILHWRGAPICIIYINQTGVGGSRVSFSLKLQI